MFRSFGRNIRIVLVIFITTYIIVSSLILFRTMEQRSLEMLRQLSVQYTGQQHKNALLFMNWLEETSKLISNNQVVQTALEKTTYDQAISPILEGIRSSSGDILGIYIWGEAGSTYSSMNVSGLLQFTEIKKSQGMEQFLLDQEKTTRWTVQNRRMLMSSPIDLRERLLLEVKIQDPEGAALGLLCLEVDLSKVYDFYLSGKNTIYGENEVYLLTGTGELLSPVATREARLQEIREALMSPVTPALGEVKEQLAIGNTHTQEDNVQVREAGDGLILLYSLPDSAEKIATYISAASMNAELRTLKYILVGLNTVVFLVFWVLISMLSGSIIAPMKQLYQKINSTMKD
ncbi:hypothetical protein J2T12_004760 [Paenibacillus anaericanus]|uniref:hypothetical protein n=1 Tax=Paenibacillus anaericanus TaxID=170367 RepID=UPI00278267C8|nr:hypothetical protein [Paenibacillus anaericanus]MDQ0091323.1 hypothetical protein [Paenibacillus anaericanus]